MENSRSSGCRLNHSEEGIDRISSLPEALHSKILSLLPTKTAVATSVLSKRWKFVWTCITNLTFDDGLLNRKYPGEDLTMKNKKFTRLVNNLLVQINPPCIQKFYLRYTNYRFDDQTCLQSLVCSAIQLTIQNFELSLILAKCMELPLSLFNCKTLAVLKLSYGIHFNVVASASVCFPNLLTLSLENIRFTIASDCSISFPSLKNLHLDYVIYANEESINKLLASCPVLDNLHLQRYSDSDNVSYFIISIPSLRSLQIYLHGFHNDYDGKARIMTVVDTPALRFLDILDESESEFVVGEMRSVSEAKLDLRARFMDKSLYGKCLYNILRAICNTKYLLLSDVTMVSLMQASSYEFPIFNNLTHLEVKYFDQKEPISLEFLTEFINSSPKLECLIYKSYEIHAKEADWVHQIQMSPNFFRCIYYD